MSEKTYIVSGEVTISCWTKVRASSKKEAESLAEERGMMHLCHYCSDGDRRSEEIWVTSGELDGTPEVKFTRVEG